MKKIIVQSFKMFLVMTFLLGIVYPTIIWAIGQIIFPYQANGSLVLRNDKIIGSELLGQNFSDSIYFQPRPSAIDYNPMPSGASNLALSSSLLSKQVKDRSNDFLTKNLLNKSVSVPAEMLFASGSGVDPDISVESAKLQVNRIIIARKLNINKTGMINNLIDSLAGNTQFGVSGNNFVNVLMLNLKLDEQSKKWMIQK
jgi:K+-transporting ATPase ATPase C chain